MPSTSLRPDGDVSNSGWTSTGANRWSVIDDDPDSPTDSDSVSTTTHPSNFVLDLTSVPIDFLSALTALTNIRLKVRYSVSGWVNDTFAFTTKLQNSSGTDISNVRTLAIGNQSLVTDVTDFTLNATGLASNDATMWNGVRLVFATTNTVSMGADSITVTITAVELNINYNALCWKPKEYISRSRIHTAWQY